jgi:predicted DNA-binding antitoxin AbrB/MazE fold protein
MKAYPSITTRIDFSKLYHLFDKLDGSNIRAEWSPKQGFYKFGSRTQLLTTEQVALYPSIDAFQHKYGDELSSRFTKARFERAVCFFEWVGPNSFAGSHPDPVSEMRPVLIDIAVYKKGILPPEKFIDFTEGLEVPALLHVGKISEELFQSVRNSTLPGMSFEGVICKGEFSQRDGGPIMAKIKSNAWLDKLKTLCNGDEALYNRLK